MKTFLEFTLAEAIVMPNWAEMNKTPEQRAAEAKKKAFQTKASQARVMPTFQELAKKRAEMTEEEIMEFLSKFFGSPKKPSPPPSPFRVKSKQTRTGHGDLAYRTDHHYGGGDIDPKSVPTFKPSF
jgi:hypothetical protein